MTFLGKLYLIPTTLGEMNPEDVLPQTINILVAMIYNDSFLLMSSTNFLNCLSVETKLSTVLQACKTVA